MFAGGLLIGPMTDRIGRRTMYTVGLVVRVLWAEETRGKSLDAASGEICDGERRRSPADEQQPVA